MRIPPAGRAQALAARRTDGATRLTAGALADAH